MKYVFILVAAVLLAGVDAGWAVEKQPAVGQKAAVGKQDQKVTEVDLGDNETKDTIEPAVGYGDGNRSIMPPWQQEDENTGIPDMVESDEEGTVRAQ